MCTGRGSNQGPLDPKYDALTTASLQHLHATVFLAVKADSMVIIITGWIMTLPSTVHHPLPRQKFRVLKEKRNMSPSQKRSLDKR